MDLNSKSLARELRHAFSRFPQAGSGGNVAPRSIAQKKRDLIPSAALLRSHGSLPMRMRRGLCSVLADDAVPVLRFLRSVSRRGTGVGVLPGRRRGVRFLSTLRAFFLLLLGSFLDSGQLAQNLHALLGSLSPTRQLNRKNLLHDGIEFRPARHAQRFQLVRDARKADAYRAPLVEVRANLRQRR